MPEKITEHESSGGASSRWRRLLDAHTGWQALTSTATAHYGRDRVTVSGMAPAERRRVGRCAVLALAAHGYDAYVQLDAEDPGSVRVMVKEQP